MSQHYCWHIQCTVSEVHCAVINDILVDHSYHITLWQTASPRGYGGRDIFNNIFVFLLCVLQPETKESWNGFIEKNKFKFKSLKCVKYQEIPFLTILASNIQTCHRTLLSFFHIWKIMNNSMGALWLTAQMLCHPWKITRRNVQGKVPSKYLAYL